MAVVAALVGNTLLDPDYVRVFAVYFIASVGMVGFYEDEFEIPSDLEQIHKRLDHEYPTVHIDFVLVKSKLRTDSIQSIAKRLDVHDDYVFVTSKTAETVGDLADLGGARIIV